MPFVALLVQKFPSGRVYSKWDLKTFGINFYIAESVPGARRFLSCLNVDLIMVNGDSFKDGGLLCAKELGTESPPIAIISTTPGYSFQIKALEQGTDDVFSWEFPIGLLALKMRKLIRMQPQPSIEEKEYLYVGELALNLRLSQADLRGKSLNLTLKQFQFLNVLAENLGEFVDRQTLAERLRQTPDGRSVDMIANRIRSRLKELGGEEFRLKAGHGLGYRLDLVDSALEDKPRPRQRDSRVKPTA